MATYFRKCMLKGKIDSINDEDDDGDDDNDDNHKFGDQIYGDSYNTGIETDHEIN